MSGFLVIVLGTGRVRGNAPCIAGNTMHDAFMRAHVWAKQNGFVVIRDNGDDPSRTENRVYVEPKA